MLSFQRKFLPWGPFLVFLAAMLWATDAPFRFFLTRTLDSSFIVLAEHAINVLLILPFIVRGWSEIRRMTLKQWLATLAIGIGASAVASILFTKAFLFVNPSTAIILQKLQPLIAISLAVLFLKEYTGRRFWLWAAVALAGAYAISFPSLRPELFVGEEWNPNTIGILLALGAAILWGAGTVLGRYLLRSNKDSSSSNEDAHNEAPVLSFQTVAALRFLLAFIFLVILNARGDTLAVISELTGKDIFFLIIVALTSGFTSLFIYYKGLETTKASVATIAELGFPFLAVIVNAATIGAFLKPMQFLGMMLLLLAVWRLSLLNREEPLKAGNSGV